MKIEISNYTDMARYPFCYGAGSRMFLTLTLDSGENVADYLNGGEVRVQLLTCAAPYNGVSQVYFFGGGTKWISCKIMQVRYFGLDRFTTTLFAEVPIGEIVAGKMTDYFKHTVYSNKHLYGNSTQVYSQNSTTKDGKLIRYYRNAWRGDLMNVWGYWLVSNFRLYDRRGVQRTISSHNLTGATQAGHMFYGSAPIFSRGLYSLVGTTSDTRDLFKEWMMLRQPIWKKPGAIEGTPFQNNILPVYELYQAEVTCFFNNSSGSYGSPTAETLPTPPTSTEYFAEETTPNAAIDVQMRKNIKEWTNVERQAFERYLSASKAIGPTTAGTNVLKPGDKPGTDLIPYDAWGRPMWAAPLVYNYLIGETNAYYAESQIHQFVWMPDPTMPKWYKINGDLTQADKGGLRLNQWFHIKHDPAGEWYVFCYINQFGVWEKLLLEGEMVEAHEAEQSEIYVGYSDAETNTPITPRGRVHRKKVLKVKSIDSTRVMMLYDMQASPVCYVEETQMFGDNHYQKTIDRYSNGNYEWKSDYTMRDMSLHKVRVSGAPQLSKYDKVSSGFSLTLEYMMDDNSQMGVLADNEWKRGGTDS